MSVACRPGNHSKQYFHRNKKTYIPKHSFTGKGESLNIKIFND